MPEQSAIGKIEARYMTEERLNRYICMEEDNLIWDPKEIRRFIELWNAGTAYSWIVKDLKRPAIEVDVLILDLRRKNRIKPRTHGLG